jgi:Fe-S-cluster containining protein
MKDAMTHCANLNLSEPIKANTLQYSGPSSCGNCKIYGGRPSACKAYQCAWKYGFGAEGDRPDKSLMLFDCSHGIENSVEAKPLKDGQQDTEAGKDVIDRMSKSMKRPVIVLNFYERRIQRIAGRGV